MIYFLYLNLNFVLLTQNFWLRELHGILTLIPKVCSNFTHQSLIIGLGEKYIPKKKKS